MNSTQIEKALARRHLEDFFITECKNGPSWGGDYLRMDAVAIKKSYTRPLVTIYEVKVSLQDFLRDNKWPQYLDYCNRFYFACPSNLIKKESLPDPRVGLIYVDEDGRCRVMKQVPSRATEIPQTFYQYILYSRLESERIPFYRDRIQYIQDYLDDKKHLKYIGQHFNSKLVARVLELESENELIAIQKENSDKYLELLKIFQRHHIYYPTPEEVEEQLSASDQRTRIQNLSKKLDELADTIKNFTSDLERNSQ